LRAGLSRIVLYERHHAKLGMSYSQFARYIAKDMQLDQQSLGQNPLQIVQVASIPVPTAAEQMPCAPAEHGFNHLPTPARRLD
jgi:hypothetical protein